MSQRMNIGLKRNGKTVLTVFSRWGGYTQPAATMLKEWYDAVLKNPPESDDELQLATIRQFENMSELEVLKKKAKTPQEVSDINEIAERLLNSTNVDIITNAMKNVLTGHGGITPEDADYAAKKFGCEFKKVEHGEGLVGISPKTIAIDEKNGFSILVDLDKKVIDFGVMCVFKKDNYDEIVEWAGEELEMDKLPHVDMPLDMIAFDDIDKWYDIIYNATLHNQCAICDDEYLYYFIV